MLGELIAALALFSGLCGCGQTVLDWQLSDSPFSFVLLGQNYLRIYSVSMELSDHSKLLCTTSTKKDISE